ncbi:hypothetical protein L218DRAFT_471362 [Marasmius fiardii PR-910]|nr:hypothetical protein L218DRAFT_471362 [Marasmius fiardii PR-910]
MTGSVSRTFESGRARRLLVLMCQATDHRRFNADYHPFLLIVFCSSSLKIWDGTPLTNDDRTALEIITLLAVSFAVTPAKLCLLKDVTPKRHELQPWYIDIPLFVFKPRFQIPRQVHHKCTFTRFSQIRKRLDRTLSVMLL